MKALLSSLLSLVLLTACGNKSDDKSDKGITLINKTYVNTPEKEKCGKESCDGDV